jgi:uncharacterized protein YndB with AHSA1/START domain
MLKKFGIVLAVLVAAVLLFATTRPNTFRVQRSTTVQAPPEKVYPLIADFHGWSRWSPWEKLDPAIQRTFSGAPAGQGAAYAWQGNSQVGAGRMEIVEATPPSRVLVKLHFIKPFEGHNTAEFTLAPKDGATEVTWAMYGPVTYLGKVMHMFFNVDRMVGQSFEQGLANLKAAAEK